jgi:hypothetical protein
MVQVPEPLSSTVAAIYRLYEDRPDVERAYLGASTFGTECDRALWYRFRWAHPPERLEGRKARLFQTGHREEARMVAELEESGIRVSGRQDSFSAVGGHMKGHLDGRVLGVPEAPAHEHVLEIKTHNEKSFKALVKDGVQESKPGHYAQMQLYMHHTGLASALYLAVCKNDDALYAERVAYDEEAALACMRRAKRIVKAEAAPSRLHEDPKAKAAFVCGWCPAASVCHEGEFARRNCRTCISATAVMDGKGTWHCEVYNKDLTFAEQLAGCASHVYLPSLVPGEQVDADAKGRTVTYRMQDQTLWTDGGS